MLRRPAQAQKVRHSSGNLAYLLLAIADGIAITAITLFVVMSLGNAEEGIPQPYLILLLILLGAMSFFYERFHVYRSDVSFTRHLVRLAKAWVFAFGFLLLLGFVTKETETYSRLMLGIIFGGGLAAQGLIHLLFRIIQGVKKRHENTCKAMIIGTGNLSNQIFYRIHDNPWINQSIVGAVYLQGTTEKDHSTDERLPVLGSIDDTIDLIEKYNVRTVYLTIPLDASSAIEPLYFRLLDHNIDVHWVPNIYSLPLINHSIGELNGLPIITLSETPLTGINRVMKELEDYVLASIILVLVSPIMLITAIAIKVTSPGPVFFRQPRTGWDGQIFRIWKFRSMRVHQPENNEVKQATRDDPRVTPVGRFIRRTSIDELPQLFNVLSGDMSLVGPRPHAIQHNEEYATKIIAYLARHRIKPGITGLAQVKGFRGETHDTELMAKRVEYDIEYINNWSVGLDLAILARTAFVLTGSNAY